MGKGFGQVFVKGGVKNYSLSFGIGSGSSSTGNYTDTISIASNEFADLQKLIFRGNLTSPSGELNVTTLTVGLVVKVSGSASSQLAIDAFNDQGFSATLQSTSGSISYIELLRGTAGTTVAIDETLDLNAFKAYISSHGGVIESISSSTYGDFLMIFTMTSRYNGTRGSWGKPFKIICVL